MSTTPPSYFDRLTPYAAKGECGLPELHDSTRACMSKIKRLAQLVQTSTKIVVLTGAGISRNAGVPDFRGPDGVWTKELGQRGGKRVRLNTEQPDTKKVDINTLRPTLAHEIIARLVSSSIISHVVSQNVDGLHYKSGLDPKHLSEIHGNVMSWFCTACNIHGYSNTDLGGMGCKTLPNVKCDSCKGVTRDTVLDWTTDIDEHVWEEAEQHIAKADLLLVLGTSLRVMPAGELPFKVGTKLKKKQGRFIIVNYQVTPLDEYAELVIRCDVDKCLDMLCKELRLQ